MPSDSQKEPPTGLSVEDRLIETERALEAMRTQQEVFAHGISHDLRAPLRAIEGFARLIDERHAEGLDAEGRAYLGRLRAAAGQMDALVNSLLQLSHVTRASLREEAVDISLLADWCLADLQDAEPERRVEASVQPDLLVHGDERLLRQLMEHLLHNAWKFSAGGDCVRISVSGDVADGRVRIRLRDEGEGFDMRYAQRMFEPFQRLHAPEQGGGHGLGLAVAHAIVERHGGQLRAESAPGQGSVFHLELPAALPSGSQA